MMFADERERCTVWLESSECTPFSPRAAVSQQRVNRPEPTRPRVVRCFAEPCMGVQQAKPALDDSRSRIQDQLNAMAQQGDEAGIRKLVALGANVDLLNTSFGKSPLHLACARAVFRTDLGYLRALLAASKDVSHPDSGGCTALHHAILSTSSTSPVQAPNALAAIELLITQGANIHIQNKHQQTPLHLAARHGLATAVSLLIAAGADVNACGADSLTPIAFAAMGDHVEAMDVLVKAGARLTFDPSVLGSPLRMAAKDCRSRAIVFLVERGANPNTWYYGAPLLHLLLNRMDGRRYALINRLLDLGADISLTDENGRTALHLVNYDPNLVRLLSCRGADLDAVDRAGLTPLFYAIRTTNLYNIGTLKALLEEGANPWIANRAGHTILDDPLCSYQRRLPAVDDLLRTFTQKQKLS